MYWYGCCLCRQKMKAAIHLGEDCNDNLVTYMNTNIEALKTLFDITQKLILTQKHEIKHVSTIEWQVAPWMRSTVLHDRVTTSKAKEHVYSDSVLCLAKMHGHPDAMMKWTEQLQFSWDPMNTENYFISVCQFEWNIFPGHTTVENYARD